MPILTEENLELVRKAIGVELTEDDLPDNVIALPIYQGRAETWATKIDPQIADRVDEELQQAQNAIAFKTAAFLVTAMPFLTEETFGVREGYRRQEVDTQKLAEALASAAQAELDAYLNPDGGSASTSFLPAFTVASGYRGR